MTLVPIPATVDVDYWTNALVFAARVADKVADTEFVSTSLRGRPDAIAATILYGAEVGVTPMAALQGIHIVEGRPAPSAELMRALIFAAGHTITVHEASGTRVRVSGLRAGRPETERVVVEWTIDMARSAGLLGRRNWQTYPRSMLMARASGELARILFPDVIKGLGYVAEELSAEDGIQASEQAPKRPRRAIQRVPQTRPPSVEDDKDDDRRDAGIAPGVSTPTAIQERLEPDQPDVQGSRTADPATSVRTPSVEDVPLPELEPEQPQDEPPPSSPDVIPLAPRMIAPGVLKAVHSTLSRELGTAATREEKLALLSAIVGREVPSSKELTRDDGYRVLDYMDRFTNGAAMWSWNPETGGIDVSDLREPPEDDELSDDDT